MIVAIDCDETYGRDPECFDYIIADLLECGHGVCIVTNNYSGSRPDIDAVARQHNIPVFYCGVHHDKSEYMYNRGVPVDVWIEDDPESI